MSRSAQAHACALDAEYREQRGREYAESARAAEDELMRQCPLCKPSGSHYARLARHDAHLDRLPAGWTMT